MAEVKWIKIVTDIFDDEKILLIESMPERDSLIVIWFKLLCMAGKQNNGGVFVLGGKMAYTDEMLATIFRRPINTVRLALQIFEQFEMIEIINDTITIPNWNKHQDLDKLEKVREQTRKRVAKHKAKQKALASGNTEVTQGNASGNAKVTQTDKSRVDKIRVNKNRVVVVEEDDDNDNDDIVENSVDNSLELMGGTLGQGVVLLTQAQSDSLLERLGLDAYNFYVDKLATFIIDKGAKVSNHYQTILKWWKEDSAV